MNCKRCGRTENVKADQYCSSCWVICADAAAHLTWGDITREQYDAILHNAPAVTPTTQEDAMNQAQTECRNCGSVDWNLTEDGICRWCMDWSTPAITPTPELTDDDVRRHVMRDETAPYGPNGYPAPEPVQLP